MTFDSIEHTFDWIEHFYVKTFFIEYFLLIENFDLTEQVINSGIRQNSILIHLFFFYFNCVLDHVLCRIAIVADDTSLN